MARVHVKVGPKFADYSVEGLPFLPGLCMHKTPNTGKSSSMFNITHTASGLAVLSYVDEEDLELIRMILGRKLWDTSKDRIFDDEKYYNLIVEAEAVLTNHERSNKQEKRIAEDVGGKRQPASGSRWGSKRDIVSPNFLIEAKSTKHPKKSVQIKDLHFLTKQAYQQGKIPAYIVELGTKQEVVIIPAQELRESMLADIGETKELCCKRKKSISLGTGLVEWVSADNCALIETTEQTYALISYCLFLEVGKRGL